MSWVEQVFNYCERGADPSFWAEPVNAVSNGAFLVAAVLAIVAFLYMGSVAPSFICSGYPAANGAARAEPCFNGSLGYAPALATLFIIGGILVWRGTPAGRKLLAAGAVFALSVLLRTIDREVCTSTHVLGQLRGTHAFWHLLNAVTLYFLLRAAIERDRPSR